MLSWKQKGCSIRIISKNALWWLTKAEYLFSRMIWLPLNRFGNKNWSYIFPSLLCWLLENWRIKKSESGSNKNSKTTRTQYLFSKVLSTRMISIIPSMNKRDMPWSCGLPGLLRRRRFWTTSKWIDWMHITYHTIITISISSISTCTWQE